MNRYGIIVQYLCLDGFCFTRKELDDETGLYYFGARYLDPKTSRWMSVDRSGSRLINPMNSDGKPRANFSMIESLNWFSYVSNNPINYTDPTGLSGQRDLGEKYGSSVKYLDIFKSAPYNDESPRMTGSSSSAFFHSSENVNGLEYAGRILPTGIGDTSKDAIDVFVSNIIDPDTKVSIKLTVETDRTKKEIRNWYFEASMPSINPDNESRTVVWDMQKIQGDDKDAALQILQENPELMYKIFDKEDNEIYYGSAIINKKGFIRFRFPSKYLDDSNIFRINGSANIAFPPLGTIEIPLMKDKNKYDLGTLIAYDYILFNFDDDKHINIDESISWDCDIPNFDFYILRVLKYIPEKYYYEVINE
ncbi:MAG: RHS repeat-associated core domain-containing protein, partial [Spirochaetaceae bacterium]|nr:RHS repeat-associated core domain-containing protein [Spirochaetaceae bacterium]